MNLFSRAIFFRYALARHLRRDQVIDPPTELGKVRGEPVYPRSSVISLKTAENWMRQGRIIRQGSQPMKMVKQRAVTVGRQREMELALERAKAEGHAGGDEGVMQGMYAFSQTEVYKPDPIKDVRPGPFFSSLSSVLRVDETLPFLNRGKFQKMISATLTCTCLPCCRKARYISHVRVSEFLPCLFCRARGSTHRGRTDKGAAKIAKKLGFDYAEAVVRAAFLIEHAHTPDFIFPFIDLDGI